MSSGGKPDESVELERWTGPWAPDDPDANFKADVALYSHAEPMETIRRLATAMNIPEGAIVRYVLAKYATGGSGSLLELGPTMTNRLWEPVEAAETAATDAARLAAYHQLRQMLSWLRLPLEDDSLYD
ncbi:MAG: DUF6027 family protein [Acidimicrobiales bacterium]